jgi:hypothetical protein
MRLILACRARWQTTVFRAEWLQSNIEEECNFWHTDYLTSGEAVSHPDFNWMFSKPITGNTSFQLAG